MNRIMSAYKKAFGVIAKRPWKLWGVVLLASLLVLIVSILTGAVPALYLVFEVLVSAAVAVIFLNALFGTVPEVEDLFKAFESWDTAKHVMGGMLWADLWIFIWALIPIVGPVFAVIRSYEYRFVPYILMTEPDVSAKEARLASKERTEGLKARMFWADFIAGAVITVVILLLSLIGQIRYIGWIFGIAAFLVSLVATFLFPLFKGLYRADFFVMREMSRPGSRFYEEPVVQLVKRSVPAPAEEAPAQEEEKACRSCGAPMRPADAFCPCCGTKYETVEASEPQEPAETEKAEEPCEAQPEKDEIQSCVEGTPE